MLIEACSIKKIYPGSTVSALDIEELKIKRGSFSIVSGSSGCGKSTLLAILGGFLKPTEGKVYIDEEEITGLNDRRLSELHREKIGYIPQSNAMLKNHNMIDNATIAFILEHRSTDRKEVTVRAMDIFSSLEIDHLAHRMPHELSGGELKRVAIARALMSDPDIVIADEPTSGLDHDTAVLILDNLRALTARGKTVIGATHDDIAKSYGTHLINIKKGRLVE